ncbi:MAG: OmpA family protein [Rhizobiales bacterium]|nr:OmpA family protein [Hyphomicrobiales bacterium]
MNHLRYMLRYAPALAVLLLVFATDLNSPPARAGEIYSTGKSCNNRYPSKKFEKDYYIYFETSSSHVDGKYLDEIARITKFAKGQNAQQICLFGKASKSGNAAANEALSRKRSASVAAIFQSYGWPASRIAIESEGEAWGWMRDALTWDAKEDRRVRIRLSM